MRLKYAAFSFITQKEFNIMSLQEICAISNQYGSNPEFVLAGGGNTSLKDEKYLYIKPSGVSLAAITEKDFVKMERAVIRQCFELKDFASKNEQEAQVKRLMAFAVTADSSGRPSVEAPLHEIMEFKYIVHLHPAAVNGMTCSVNARQACAELFPEALFVPLVDPGYTLAKTTYDLYNEYKKTNGKAPAVIFLQNHGVFAGADSAEGINKIYDNIMSTLKAFYASKNVSTELDFTAELDTECVMANAPLLRGYLAPAGSVVTVTSSAPFAVASGPLTPDHIVYAKSFGLTADEFTKDAVDAFKAAKGYLPKVTAIPGKAVFCAGASKSQADTVLTLAKDAALVEKLAKAFGGVHYFEDVYREFIENWEVESYRSKVNAAGSNKALAGKVAVVTGGAQGFGYGIAEVLAEQGADLVIADVNVEGAKNAALKLGKGASGVAVNVADEESVANMVTEITKLYGGIDLFVANAGVVRSGSVKLFEKKDWDFVTNINYTGYYLCCKYAARVMALQNSASGLWSDIVQVNSKSGLVGSNRNGAYAGSKFGTIGLTQSFALELVGDKIKVNSVCPGNFFDGPLWSDPVKGLFVQYLQSGKVPGATNVTQVKEHYEKQIPMHRGCLPTDVAKAIIYCSVQLYETGQAIPVSGGQVMLN